MSNKVTQVQIRSRTFNNKYSAAQGTVCLKANVAQYIEHKRYKITDELNSLVYSDFLVKGKAVCSSEDEFDPKLGMKIATNRARFKGNERLLKRVRAVRKQLQEFDEFLSSMEADIRHEQIDCLIFKQDTK